MILDTNAVSALFTGDDQLAEVLAVAPRHHLPVIVLGEYRFGLRRSRHRAKLESLLDQLEQASILLVVDSDTARHYAELREQLRQQGRPIPENDVWIAALAAQHKLPIVSRDDHFTALAKIKRVTW